MATSLSTALPRHAERCHAIVLLRRAPNRHQWFAAVNEPLMLSLVRALCTTLEAENVGYCHWKSTAFLDRSASAERDLDLLVRRTDAAAFAAILRRFGFKEARKRSGTLPAVTDYFGYDREANKFVHVHVHYQLIVGDDMTKNYRIPLEKQILAVSIRDGIFRISPREVELIMFVIRMTLKHSAWDAVVAGQGRLPAAARKELDYLRDRTDPSLLSGFLRKHMPFVDEAVFAACTRALAPNSRIWSRMQSARRLHTQLKPYARRSRAVDVLLKFGRRTKRALSRRFSEIPADRRLLTGGVIIAVVGGDGSGKSTVVQELAQWLSKDFTTVRIHFGKPPRSWRTYLLHGALKLSKLRPARRHPVARAPEEGRQAAQESSAAHLLQSLLYVSVARDRYSTYVKARQFAANGGIVVGDRFPLSEIESMDRPKLARSSGHGGRLVRVLAQWERRYFEAFMPPDVLLILRVSPEIAVERKREERPEVVRSRCREVWELDWRGTQARVIDADRSPADILADVKAVVWAEL
jgi:thymidylate kinase